VPELVALFNEWEQKYESCKRDFQRKFIAGESEKILLEAFANLNKYH